MVLQRLLGGLGGGVGIPAQVTGQGDEAPYKTMLTPTDGDLGAGEPAAMIAILAAMVAGQNLLIWERTVLAQEQVRWGYGSPSMAMNQGYLWWGFSSAAAYIEGKLRLVQSTARNTRSKTVTHLDVNQLHNYVAFTLVGMQQNDKNTMMALPEKREFPKVGQDSLLQMWFECTTAVVVTVGGFSIPITVYE